jgi:hypothetical protein
MRLKRGLLRAVGRLADAAVQLAAPASVTWLTGAAVVLPTPAPPPGPWFADEVPPPSAARPAGQAVSWTRRWLPAHVPASSPLRRRPLVRLRVRAPPAPTRQLLVVTGFNMGWAGLDARVLDLRWWLGRGYRVAVLGLPLHGTLAQALGPPAWPSADLDLTRDALAAATQDVREAVAYLRAEAPLPVVALGVSLGAWPVALAGTTSAPPDVLAALTPMVDYAALLRAHAPPWVLDNVLRRIGEVLRPLAPLERAPTMPPGRTLILAAASDHVTAARDHAEPLAAHFRGELRRFPGSHLLPWGLRRAWEALDAHAGASAPGTAGL